MIVFSFENYLRDHICCLLKPKIIIAFVAIFSIHLIKLVFPFHYTSYKIIHLGGSLSLNVTRLFGIRFEKMFNNTSRKRDKCLWTRFLSNITSKLASSMDFLMLLTFVLLWSHIKQVFNDEIHFAIWNLMMIIWL